MATRRIAPQARPMPAIPIATGRPAPPQVRRPTATPPALTRPVAPVQKRKPPPPPPPSEEEEVQDEVGTTDQRDEFALDEGDDGMIPDGVLNDIQLPQPGEIARNTVAGYKTMKSCEYDEEQQPSVVPYVKQQPVTLKKKPQQQQQKIKYEEPQEEEPQGYDEEQAFAYIEPKEEEDEDEVKPKTKPSVTPAYANPPPAKKPASESVITQASVRDIEQYEMGIIYPDQYDTFDINKLKIGAPVVATKGGGYMLPLKYEGRVLKIQLNKLFTTGVTTFDENKKVFPYIGESKEGQLKTMTLFFGKNWQSCPETQRIKKIIDDIYAKCMATVKEYPKTTWEKVPTAWANYKSIDCLTSYKEDSLLLNATVVQAPAAKPVDPKKAAKGDVVKGGIPKKTFFFTEDPENPERYLSSCEKDFWQVKQHVYAIIEIPWIHVAVHVDKKTVEKYCKVKPAVKLTQVVAASKEPDAAGLACYVKPNRNLTTKDTVQLANNVEQKVAVQPIAAVQTDVKQPSQTPSTLPPGIASIVDAVGQMTDE